MSSLGHATESVGPGPRSYAEPTGVGRDVVPGPPVLCPQKSSKDSTIRPRRRGSMEVPKNPLVFTQVPVLPPLGPTADVELRSDFCDYEVQLRS